MLRKITSDFRYKLLALFAGMVLPLAFDPFHWSFLSILSPAALLAIWLNCSPKQAALRGWLFGLGFFGIGISWVYISIHVFGHAPVPAAVFITMIFVVYLSLFFAGQGYLLNYLFPEISFFKLFVAFPSFWVLFELLRSNLFTGFPWILLGYSQSDTLLKAFAPVIGVYGISFILILLSSLLVAFLKANSLYTRSWLIVTFCLILALATFFSKQEWTSNAGNPMRVTLIQGNIEQELKWRPDQIIKTLHLYSQHTQNNWSSDLIIWPEGAVTLPYSEAKAFLADLDTQAKKHNSALITGIPVIEPDAAYNSVVAMGNGSGLYNKRHLVPFGEYIPLKSFYRYVMQFFNIPMSNFDHGREDQNPLISKGIFVAPYICYEITYPLEVLAFLPKANLLLTVTDDSWFGHSIAQAQHLQMAQIRASEVGRYLLFSSNTGITAIINNHGVITKRIPPFEEGVLTGVVEPKSGTTPWMIYRIYPLVGLFLLTFIVGLSRKFAGTKRSFALRLNGRG